MRELHFPSSPSPRTSCIILLKMTLLLILHVASPSQTNTSAPQPVNPQPSAPQSSSSQPSSLQVLPPHNTKNGRIAGSVVGGVISLALLTCIALFLRINRKRAFKSQAEPGHDQDVEYLSQDLSASRKEPAELVGERTRELPGLIAPWEVDYGAGLIELRGDKSLDDIRV